MTLEPSSKSYQFFIPYSCMQVRSMQFLEMSAKLYLGFAFSLFRLFTYLETLTLKIFFLISVALVSRFSGRKIVFSFSCSSVHHASPLFV